MKPFVQQHNGLSENSEDLYPVSERKNIDEEEQCVPEEWNLSCIGDTENTLDLPSLSQPSTKRDFWVASNQQNSSTPCMYSSQPPTKQNTWVTCNQNTSLIRLSHSQTVDDQKETIDIIKLSNQLLDSHTGQIDNITTPSLADNITTPSLVDNITTPSLVDNITTPSLVDNITTPSLADNITTPSLVDNITTPSLADNITTPSLVDNITTPTLVDNITTPSLADNITTPSLVDNITTPTLVDNITTPLLADNITTPSLADNITTPSLADNITTTSLADNITTPSLVDNITTPSLVDNNTTPLLVDNFTTPSLVEVVDPQTDNIAVPFPLITNNKESACVLLPTSSPELQVSPAAPLLPTSSPELHVSPAAPLLPTSSPELHVSPASPLLPTSSPELHVSPAAPLLPTSSPELHVSPATVTNHLSDIQFPNDSNNNSAFPMFSFFNPPSLLSKESLMKRLSTCNNVKDTCIPVGKLLSKLEMNFNMSFAKTIEYDHCEPCCKKSKLYDNSTVEGEQLNKGSDTIRHMQNNAVVPNYEESTSTVDNDQCIFTAVPTNTTHTITTCLSKTRNVATEQQRHELQQNNMKFARNLLGKN